MIPGNERQDVENGGKIILPPSALEHLTRLNTAYPMLFKLTNSRKDRETHCGVLEFVADEGRCYIPNWMMRNLLLEEGNIVKIQSVSLPVANFSKFEPQSSDFLDITNPKAVLENALRNFACLTAGDMIAIRYNDRSYELRVLETKPGPAVSIIECDMDVDFAPPADYVEPVRQPRNQMDTTENDATEEAMEGVVNFQPFVGSGNRLDGKAAESILVPSTKGVVVRGIPDYEYQVGHIQFFRRRIPSSAKKNANDDNNFKAFEGSGFTIRSQ
jgi:ubiquitin fusion degradation protein 1